LKRLIWFSLFCIAYIVGGLASFVHFNKSTIELATYRTVVSSIPARVRPSMSQHEIDHLASHIEAIQFGGDLSSLGLRFKVKPANSYLEPSSFDFPAGLNLLRQKRFSAAQTKFDLLVSKVDVVYERRLQLFSIMALVAIGLAILLVSILFWKLYRAKSKVHKEVEFVAEDEVQGHDFVRHLQAVAEEEAKFSGHRVQLKCVGFDNDEFAIGLDGSQSSSKAQLRETIELIIEHLVRNSIEHGGRAPELRLLAGKPEYLSVRVTLQDVGSTCKTYFSWWFQHA